jgi:hypothetical protein
MEAEYQHPKARKQAKAKDISETKENEGNAPGTSEKRPVTPKQNVPNKPVLAPIKMQVPVPIGVLRDTRKKTQ